MAASPCHGPVMNHGVGEAVISSILHSNQTSFTTLLLRPNASLPTSDPNQLSGAGGISPCFCDKRWWQPSVAVARYVSFWVGAESDLQDDPHVEDFFFLRRFLEWMAAFAKTAGLVFSSECGREAICAALKTAVGHQALLFRWTDSLFCPLRNLTTSSVSSLIFVFLNCGQWVNVGTCCSVTLMGVIMYWPPSSNFSG